MRLTTFGGAYSTRRVHRFSILQLRTFISSTVGTPLDFQPEVLEHRGLRYYMSVSEIRIWPRRSQTIPSCRNYYSSVGSNHSHLMQPSSLKIEMISNTSFPFHRSRVSELFQYPQEQHKNKYFITSFRLPARDISSDRCLGSHQAAPQPHGHTPARDVRCRRSAFRSSTRCHAGRR